MYLIVNQTINVDTYQYKSITLMLKGQCLCKQLCDRNNQDKEHHHHMNNSETTKWPIKYAIQTTPENFKREIRSSPIRLTCQCKQKCPKQKKNYFM